MSSELLQQAYRLIREGNKPEAVRLLTPLVRTDPLNADAWWLLANALDNPDQKRRALEQVLKLRPNDDAAKRMYDRLQPVAASAPPLKKKTVKTQRVDASEAVPEFEEVETDGDIFESYDPMLEDRPAPRKSSGRRSSSGGGGGRSPIVTCLAFIGALTVLSCVACLAITAFSLPRISDELNDIMLTVTADPALVDFVNSLSTGVPQFGDILATYQPSMPQGAPQGAATLPAPPAALGATIPDDLMGRGTINKGETVMQTLDLARDDAWTFSADVGEHVVIELSANGSDLDPHLYLYDGSRALIAENDDIDGNNANSRIEITLTQAGKYTIRVSRFSGGGDYLLKLS